MKKNGYLRRFLALFLTFVMLMADSSVTTFAATVGRVQRKNESQKEENTQTIYTYEDSRIVVTATLENADAIPDNANFVVTKMNEAEHQDDYAYAEQKLKEYEEAENIIYDSYLIYDMHFEDEEGNEIEPAEGQVSVNISYKKAQKLSEETTEDSVQVLHLDENTDQLEDVTDSVELNKKGKIEEVALTTDSFSTFIIADQGLSSFKLKLQLTDAQGNIATSQNGTYYVKIEKDWLHQYKTLDVRNGIGEVTFDGLYDDNGTYRKSVETGEYSVTFATARPNQNPIMNSQNSNSWDRNNALVEMDSEQAFDYQFKRTEGNNYTVDASNDTIVVNAVQMGTDDVSYDNIKSGLSDASHFMVVANSFTQSMHFEGNFAVNVFNGIQGQPVGVNGSEKKINLTVNITKTVTPAAAKTFHFRIVDANGNTVQDVSVSTNSQGVGSTSYRIENAKSAYKVYEVDSKTEDILDDGQESGGYTVSYDYVDEPDGGNGLLNYDTTSFAKVINNVSQLTTNSNNNLFITTSKVGIQNGAIEQVSNEKFDSLINIGNILNDVSNLSKVLAKSKSTDSAAVMYLTPNDLQKEKLFLPAITDDQALVLNVMIPQGTSKVNVNSTQLYVGNYLVDVAGKTYRDLASGNKGDQIAKRTIWNFVYEDGTPYDGYVEDTGKKMGGFALVPEGSYKNNNGMCSIYAGSVSQGNAEIHKCSFPGDQEKSGTVKIDNRVEEDKTKVSVTKVWDDENNQDGIRPDSIQVQLYKDGAASGEAITLSEDNDWAYTWSDLDKNSTYTVKEAGTVDGYTTVVTGSGATGFVITNTHTPETTSISGTKNWNDEDNKNGNRPNSITVNLFADGAKIASKKVTAANGWNYSFEDLPVYKNKTKIVYTVTEEAVTGYQSSVTDYNITNTEETTKVEGTKTWNDNDNENGNRPDSITVNLLADGVKVDSQTVTADNNWTYSFKDLPVYKDQKQITYTVSEEAVTGYNPSVTGYDIANTEKTTKVEGNKTWSDNDNEDGNRPISITVNLLADGIKVDSQIVTADTNWTYSFDNLPVYKDQKRITYTVSEEAVTGYTSSVTGYDVTNTEEITKVEGTKTWSDNDNKDGNRPTSITVNLLADGIKIASKEVSAADNWSYSFDNLPVYKNKTRVVYTITEETVADYTPVYDGTNIENRYTPGEASATVMKVWNDADNQDGKRPVSITVSLLANGESTGKTVTLNADNNWQDTINGLQEKANGQLIKYTWSEDVPAGYELTTNKTEGKVTTLTNTYTPETTDIVGTKTWNDNDNENGNRPDSITVNLLADGVKVDSQIVTADNNWTYSFKDLPVYKDQKQITYTVSEEAATGYTSSVTGYDITNTEETTKVEGTKTWSDNDNEDGNRPTSITVNLLADGIKVASQTVTADNNWIYSFKDLPVYKDQKQITYTVSEEAVIGYTSSVTGYDIANTEETTKVEGIKTWSDNDNEDGNRPTSITVNLLADGIKVDSQTVTADVNWRYSFKDLPVYKDQKQITYTVSEEAVTGYNPSVIGYDITNTEETTKVEGTKTWSDNDNKDGNRPTSITVNLLADGIKIASKEVSAADNWSYSFDNLPVYKNKTRVVYTITEETVADYTPVYDGTNIENRYTPGEASATVMKVWNDADNQDGKRPGSITVSLLANGESTGKTVTLNADNNWQDTINGLQEKANGQLIEYTWSEDVPAGYELTTNKTEGQLTTLTNTHTPETTDIAGTKTWNDNDNENGNRPESITVNLLADGVVIASKVVKATDNWSYSFKDLPVYKDQKQITYTVTEEAVTGYQSSVTNYDVTNTEVITKVEGSKTWSDNDNKDGNRPTSITVNLLANGIKIASKEVSEADNWSYSFDNLPVYKNKNKVVYTVTEEAVIDYTPVYDGTNIENRYTPGETSATVMKVWDDADNQDGKRPTSITVSLLANEEPTGKTVTLSADNNWQATISGLQEKANGQLIEYTWSEDVPAGYELTTNKTEGKVTTLTNTHTPETTDIAGTKTWNDNNNENENRPDSITVNLLADGVKVDSRTVTADNNWAYSFKDLPVYKDQKQITYTVSEEAVTGYNPSVTGYDITNTEETTKVEGNKTWSDADNQDGKRPTSITVNLLANGEKVAEQTVTADTDWTYTFENLPVYKDQKQITYTISEDPVADYTTEYDGYNITNSYTPGKTSATITKIWSDAENQDGKRPENITVSLLADGEATGTTVTLNADNNWTETVTDLPEKANGQAIEYTWTEENVPEGYQLTGNNTVGTVTTLTNTYTPETTSVTGTKTWSDNNQTAKRPLSITVRLFADGTEKASQTVTAGEDGTWTYSFTDLPKYEAGKEIAYTVSEDPVPGYVTSTDGYNITNTITSVKVSKVDVADGKELAGAHIQILDQDGNVVEEWDSTGEAHEVTGLKTGAKYTLRETVAPDGYALTADTTFVLKEDGTVDKDNTSTTISQEGVLLVEDSLATSPSIAVTKKLTYIGENLTARDQTFYVALYSDEACTQRVSDVKAIEFKNADSSTVTFTDNIEAKKTYYIGECTADGTAQSSGTLADGTLYAANFNEGNSAVVEEANGTTTVTFENVFSSFPDGFYKQGQLTVTKKLLGADGDAKNSSKVFYAGIFDDADYTQLSTRVDRNIVALDLGGGNEVSETVNVGLEENGEVTLYVTETDVNGNPVAGSEGFGYKVSVSADSVTFDMNNLAASVVITNQEETNETITPTPTETPSNGGGENNGETPSENHGGSSTKSPKTGDNTPVEMYLVLLLAAAMLVAETERRRRKSKRQ